MRKDAFFARTNMSLKIFSHNMETNSSESHQAQSQTMRSKTAETMTPQSRELTIFIVGKIN